MPLTAALAAVSMAERGQCAQVPAEGELPPAQPGGRLPGAEEADVPQEFLCPISLEIMTAPVVCLQTRQVYDAHSMHVWLTGGGLRDPMTGQAFKSPVVLRPHLPLQQRIAAWCAEHGVAYAPREWRPQAPTQLGGPACKPRGSLLRELLRSLGKFLASKRPQAP